MIKLKTYNYLTLFIASIWITNGLFCKVLNLAPRHEQIVSRILGQNYSQEITIFIGFLEVIMAIWILSSLKPRINAFVQITLITSMNTIEFIKAKDLLLWGEFNAVFAILLIIIIYYANFKTKKHYAITT